MKVKERFVESSGGMTVGVATAMSCLDYPLPTCGFPHPNRERVYCIREEHDHTWPHLGIVGKAPHRLYIEFEIEEVK